MRWRKESATLYRELGAGKPAALDLGQPEGCTGIASPKYGEVRGVTGMAVAPVHFTRRRLSASRIGGSDDGFQRKRAEKARIS